MTTEVFQSKMNFYLTICASLITFLQANGQVLRYASRFRNFSIESETGSIHLVNMKLYQDKNEHKLACTVNITKDINVKSIEVVVDRCSFEKYDCEYFQRWKFNAKLKSVVYMKNQIWTPVVKSITPRLDFPIMNKNIYQTKDASVDPNAVMIFYPEAMNYFWRANAVLNDINGKKGAVLKFELSIFSYTERPEKKHSRNRETKTAN